ncbi:hypothetical protein FIBSPDRAFT_874628 [Athelia psychrophila]|uniref:Uncharacterized protein n=1 Tax=Athelia psychrophila TaxID=1759441 RepID=A0A165XA41_9AGAM|nr:hypothetical protein FIBSPDRAFT_874628 [Fibularhizoctonia sp. CBS 109695]
MEDLTSPLRPFIEAPTRILSPGPRGRPMGPRIPKQVPPQPGRGLTVDISNSQSPSHFISPSPSPSLSRLETISPAQFLPQVAPPFSHDGVPPLYAESHYPSVQSLAPINAAMPTFVDVGTQTSRPPTPSVEPRPVLVKTLSKAVTLTPPPQLDFEKVPISFKGIPLEAAQWTFSSSELQEVVARAIRLSAREGFIRILSIETLDKTISEEQDRLATLKVTTQSQYRFQVHRRTMQLQALNSIAAAVPHDPDAVCSLAGQLSETTAACDRLMEELLRVADQQAQIAKVLDLHWASALAIALRKINKSYEKRVGELRVSQDRVEILEAELKEAWKEAEDIAREMDDIEDANWEDDDVTTHTAHMVGVVGRAQVAEAKLMDQKEASSSQIFSKPERPKTAPPSVFTASEQGGSSGPSSGNHSRSHSRSRSIKLTAAKTRSRRTSDASLRVSKRSIKKAEGMAPPVPSLPVEFDAEENFIDLDPSTPTRRITAPREKSHPYASSSSGVPAFWVSADSPKKPPTKRASASMQPQHSDPLMRQDSGGRSISRYSHLVRPSTSISRRSLPLLSGSSQGHTLHRIDSS